VEPLLRRATFLGEVVADLQPLLEPDTQRFEVVRSRAEDLRGRRDFDTVVARAVAPLERLLGWTEPLLAEAGCLIAIKGTSAGDEVVQAAPLLEARGLTASVETASRGSSLVTAVIVRRKG
jgi:16S rRNA (guanine527-N7)-methyltransferase